MQGTTAPLLPEVDAAQEIADLKDKLANLQKAHDALMDERDNLREEIVKQAEGYAMDTSDMVDEIEELRGTIRDHEDRLRISGDDIWDLVKARDMLKKGQRAVALAELERVLDRSAGAWRTGGCNVGEGLPL